jgi:hypothetical protein
MCILLPYGANRAAMTKQAFVSAGKRRPPLLLMRTYARGGSR